MPNHHLLAVFYNTNVPLTLALVSLGLALFDASRTPMLEAAVCAGWYREYQPSAIEPDGLVPEQMCKGNEIQTQVALINGGFLYAGGLGALVLAMPYAWLATKLSKQFLLLVGTTSTAAQYASFYAICRYTTWNMRCVWWLTLFDAIGGGNRITYVMLWSLVADATQPQLRSSVFFTISSALLLVQFLGMAMSGFLLQTSPWTVGPVASLVYALNAPILILTGLHSHFKCWLRRSGEGNRQRLLGLDGDVDDDAQSADIDAEISDASEEPKTSSFVKTFVTNIGAWLRMVYRQFFQHVIFQLSFLMHVLLVTAMGTEIILQQWVSRTFTWTLANTTYTLAYTMFLSFVVLASLPIINARLRPRFKNAQAMDSNLVRWNLLIRSFGAFLLAFSFNPFLYIASITIYTLGVGLYESVKALLTSFAPPDQTTELYTVIMMLEQVTGLISSLLWPRVLAATFAVDAFWRGLPFLLSSLFYGIAFLILMRIWRSNLNF